MKDDLISRIERIEGQLQLAETYSVKGFWRALDQAYKHILSTRELRCIVCDNVSNRDGFRVHTSQCTFGGGDLERYECPKCDCIFGPQKYLDLDEGFVDLDYKLLYTRYNETDSTDNEIRTFHSIAGPKDGYYLDWGCGVWSRTIARLRSEGWAVYGYEPSAENTGDFVVNHRGSISAKFDGIFSNNVIEHFRNPVAEFEYFYSVLKDGARMGHSTACYEYSYEFTRFHTLFLLGRSPEVLAERTGFKVVSRTREGEYINVVYERV